MIMQKAQRYLLLLVTRYDLYTKRCPFCGYDHLIRWGYYTRRGLPISAHIRIQRVRCKNCHRTTNVLPSFLLANNQHAVNLIGDLLSCYIKQPNDWHHSPDITMDLSTAYRYLRILTQQANDALPQLRKTLLCIHPQYRLNDHIDGNPVSVSERRCILQRFLSLAKRLLTEGVHLIDDSCVDAVTLFPFINYFLASQTGNALLQR
ncbi:transposase family protein [candidate division KSB1 bacterium]|nr:transposase family protein [candidate division KSB1 bacterium]